MVTGQSDGYGLTARDLLDRGVCAFEDKNISVIVELLTNFDLRLFATFGLPPSQPASAATAATAGVLVGR